MACVGFGEPSCGLYGRSVRVRLSRLPLFRVPKRAPEQSGDFMLLPELAFSFMESQKCIELGQLSAA